MARYGTRSCLRCSGYLGIVLREPKRNALLQAINGRCLECGYRLAWILVRGRRSPAGRYCSSFIALKFLWLRLARNVPKYRNYRLYGAGVVVLVVAQPIQDLSA